MKELTKVPQIKHYIALDPANPGTISKQRYVNSKGKKSKYYYLWQSSFLGKKKSIRIPKNAVGELKQYISSIEDIAKRKNAKTISTFNTYNKALDSLMQQNKKIREKNKEAIKDITKEQNNIKKHSKKNSKYSTKAKNKSKSKSETKSKST